MRHRCTTLIISLLLLIFTASTLKAQKFFVETRIDSLAMCPDVPTAFPVVVKNMIGVDSFNLVLNFSNTAIQFLSYDAASLKPVFADNFSLTENAGTITINWHGSVANLFNDTLVTLVFNGINGGTPLRWDTLTPGNCIYYTDDTTSLSTQCISGYAFVFPPMHLTLLQSGDNPCQGKCTAGFSASVTGGSKPYEYYWNEELTQIPNIAKNLCGGENKIRVKDIQGCTIDSTFTINERPGPKIELQADCEGVDVIQNDSIYLYREHPVLTFHVSDAGDDAINPSFEWDFGDSIATSKVTTTVPEITHVYETASDHNIKKYILSLKVSTSDGCDSIYKFTIRIKDDTIIKINNVLVPKGMSGNQNFMVADENWDCLAPKFEYIEVVIFDRWGRKIYSSSNYQCDWRAEGLPDGVYYYVVKIVGADITHKRKGSLTIVGSSN
jgi:hypothetical protein